MRFQVAWNVKYVKFISYIEGLLPRPHWRELSEKEHPWPLPHDGLRGTNDVMHELNELNMARKKLVVPWPRLKVFLFRAKTSAQKRLAELEVRLFDWAVFSSRRYGGVLDFPLNIPNFEFMAERWCTMAFSASLPTAKKAAPVKDNVVDSFWRTLDKSNDMNKLKELDMMLSSDDKLRTLQEHVKNAGRMKN